MVEGCHGITDKDRVLQQQTEVRWPRELNFKKHMQTENAPANQENIFINLTADASNAHNTTK